MANPHVSVVITVYNEERYLGEAIRSILKQDYDDFEVVVVDDGSTDRSVEIARQFEEVRIISQENAGHGAALNTGVAKARGKILAFLDADDRWEPGTLALRVARFGKDPSLEMTHDLLVEFVSPEIELQNVVTGRAVGRRFPGRLSGSTMVRRSAMDRVGSFETEHKLGSWMDWLMRADEAGLKTELHDELVLHRRIHGDNLGIRESSSQSDYVKLLKLALDRRRKQTDSNPNRGSFS